MKLNKANTQLGVTAQVNEFEDADILQMIQDPTKLTRVTDCVNADRRQKVALVDFRDDLADRVYGKNPDGTPVEGVTNAVGFARQVASATKDGETVYTWAETENKFIKRFLDALVAGTFVAPGYTNPSGDEAVKEAAAIKYLQSLADSCGVYTLDITKAVRKAGTGLIAKWALDAAANIIKNGSQAKWVSNFTNGYTSARGVVITPIEFSDFQQVAASTATPEEVQAVATLNQRNLAKAISAARAQENEAAKLEFA